MDDGTPPPAPGAPACRGPPPLPLLESRNGALFHESVEVPVELCISESKTSTNAPFIAIGVAAGSQSPNTWEAAFMPLFGSFAMLMSATAAPAIVGTLMKMPAKPKASVAAVTTGSGSSGPWIGENVKVIVVTDEGTSSSLVLNPVPLKPFLIR